MLELIFQGLIEWIYGLILEAWEYFVVVFMDILSLDFTYLEDHMDVLPLIRHSILAIGWALLIGNLVFQATKSMMTGLGFEGEDPKLLFTRSFVFAFLLVASPLICDLGLEFTSKIITLLEIPDAVDVTLVGEDAFGASDVTWLLVIVVNIVLMFKVFRMLLEMVEQYLVLAFLTICAPMAFGMGGSRNTSDIFTGWCRMYGSMCFVIMSNMIFFKLLLSLLSSVPTGTDILLWIALVFGLVRVARKVDAIITRIGLNPAITGDGLGGRTLPGMLAYTVIRSMASNIVKAAGKSAGSTAGGGSSGGGAGARAGDRPIFRGPSGGAGTGATAGTQRNAAQNTASTSAQSTQNNSGSTTAQSSASHNSSQTMAQQGIPGHPSPAQAANAAQDNVEAAAKDDAAPITDVNRVTPQAQARGGTDAVPSSARKSSVPLGTARAPSLVNPESGRTGEKSTRTPTAGGASTSRNSSSSKNSSVYSVRGRNGTADTSAKGTQQQSQNSTPDTAETGGDSALRTGGAEKMPRPGLAGAGREPGSRLSSNASGNIKPGAAGNASGAIGTDRNTRRASPSVTAGKGAASGVQAPTETVNGSRTDSAGTVPVYSGKGVMPQPGLADMGTTSKSPTGQSAVSRTGTESAGRSGIGSSSRKLSFKSATAQPGTAGNGENVPPRNFSIKPGMAQTGTAGNGEGVSSRQSAFKSAASQPGMAGNGENMPSRNTSVKPGIAQIGTAGNGESVSSRQSAFKSATAQPGTAGNGENVPSRNSSVKPGMAQTSTAGSGKGVSSHQTSFRTTTAQPGTAGTGVMPQQGLGEKVGSSRQTVHGTTVSQSGNAGNRIGSDTRKSSIGPTTPRPGIVGTSGIQPASDMTNTTVHGVEGQGSNPVFTSGPGENSSVHAGMGGFAPVPSEHMAHVGAPSQTRDPGASGSPSMTRFSNAARVTQNQTVQNSVQSAQQSAVTLDGAKQTTAPGAGKVPPAAAPATSVSDGGKENRFTQRPGSMPASDHGSFYQPGMAGMADQQNTSGTHATRDGFRPANSAAPVPPAGALNSGATPQETRVSHSSAESMGASRPGTQASSGIGTGTPVRGDTSASKAKQIGGAKQISSSGTGLQQKPKTSSSVRVDEAGKRAGSVPIGQERLTTARQSAAQSPAATVPRQGMAGITPPAARASRKEQPETRPPRPEKAADEITPEISQADGGMGIEVSTESSAETAETVTGGATETEAGDGRT